MSHSNETANMMNGTDRRKERRLGRQFPLLLHCVDSTDLVIEGMSENLSQGGAFIKTSQYRSCEVGKPVVITFLLPPDFTGQERTIGLQGRGTIVRIDEEHGGFGVRFDKNFRQFEQVEASRATVESIHKSVGYYLEKFGEMQKQQFLEIFPGGFLVEKSKTIFDKNSVLQFTTEIIDDGKIAENESNVLIDPRTLSTTVIEITKQASDVDDISIYIGRANTNDIILYNKLVSRNHAHIRFNLSEKKCYLVDSASANGTFVNKNKLIPEKEYLLSDGDEISFGPHTKVVYFSSESFHKLLSELRASSC
ncbi:MAG: FHA domain-containing protein [Deltaproteobacteria bacterium]|nr:FHA domain-containing protein [Deltaproteobacteria bacterium]MBW2070227.1 FHA domain-containing protein [Deltaproteobacteria bacterium]